MSSQHTQAIQLNGALFIPNYIEWNGLLGLKHCPGCGARVLFPPSWIGKRAVVS